MAARTVPTMPDWTSHEQATSVLLEQITAYTRFWASPPMFRMYQTVAQSVPTATFTQITCDTLDYDTDSGRGAITPWSYTIPVGMTARWTFSGITGFVSNSSGFRIGIFYKNGTAVTTTQIAAQPVSAALATTDMAVATATLLCNAGDVIGLYGYQTSGGALNTDAGHCAFEGRLVSLANP
jgi:hypothetical protein